MPSQRAIELAAQAWCTPKTSHIEMDVVLANAFAEILDDYLPTVCGGIERKTREYYDDADGEVLIPERVKVWKPSWWSKDEETET